MGDRKESRAPQQPKLPLAQRHRLAKIAVRRQLLHGVPVASTAERLGVDAKRLGSWIAWMPHVERKGRRDPDMARRLSVGIKWTATEKVRLLRKAYRMLKQGYTVNAITSELRVSKESLAGWIQEDNLWEFFEGVRSMRREQVRRPPVERPGWKGGGGPRQRNVSRMRPEMRSISHVHPAWYNAIRDHHIREQARRRCEELESGYGSLSEERKVLLRQVVHLESIADRISAKIELTHNAELADLPGAEQTLYDWWLLYGKIARELRNTLRDLERGVGSQAVAPRPDFGDVILDDDDDGEEDD